MTTHDRHTEDVPTLTEVGPRTAPTDERWQQPEWASPDDDHADRDRANPPASERGREDSVDVANTPPSDTEAPPATGRAPDTSLFADDELAGLRARWDDVQAGFVDDPKDCVSRADGLVSEVVGQLTSGFTEVRSRLESHWGRGEEATTEDLRVALTRYRDFFDRLLSV